MKHELSERRSTTVALLASLFVHSNILLYLLYSYTDTLKKNTDQKQKNINQQIHSPVSWAATEERSAPYGAPIFFTPEPENLITTPTDENKALTLQNDDNSTEQNNLLKSDDIQDNNVLDIPANISKQPITQHNKKYITQTPLRRLSPHAITTQQKNKPTLAQLTNGFLHATRTNGSHGVTMLGKKNATPTDEQLKYERYLERLKNCLHSTLAIHREKFPPNTGNDLTTHILLALNKDGSIKALTVEQSSGDLRLDAFLLFIFRDASSSFPPVPSYLPHDPFTMGYIVQTNASYNNFKFFRY